jgi:nickel-dependent lactate racemase
MTGMQTVDLAYGHGHLSVPVLPGSTVVTPTDPAPLTDVDSAVRAALAAPLDCRPLTELAAGVSTIAISVCDGTRAQPRREVIEPLLDLLDRAGCTAEIAILVATGTHRGNSDAELDTMLGPVIRERCVVLNHDARDRGSLTDLGTVGSVLAGRGVPLSLMSAWVDAELRITTGFVEPHFFAGFSGGPKMIAPGLAGLDTVMTLHDAAHIGDARAAFGVIDDNPVHADIRACAAACPPHLAIDVTLDRDKRVTAVFAGGLSAMHRAACAAARTVAMRPVDRPFEVVVTTNSGFPLDQNLYQAVKGMSAADRVVADGGTIVVAAECADGLPAHGSFAEVLRSAPTAQGLLELIGSPGFAVPDQWQVQVLARILDRAAVFVHCDGLDEAALAEAHLGIAPDIAETVERALAKAGPGARVCYLPEGPQTIPYLAA